MVLFFQKALAVFLAFFQTLFINIGLIKPDGYNTDVSPISTALTSVKVENEEESNLIYSAEYAASMRNQVQRVYGDSERNSAVMTNSQITLTHQLTGFERYATLADKNGNEYITSSFKSFFTTKTGGKKYFENSNKEDGRVNDIRLGLYYYDSHVRDFKISTVDNTYGVDKGFRVFSDKLYMEYSLLALNATNKVKSFGSEIEISKDKVKAVEIVDKNGTHNNLDNIDASSVQYAAFDIDGAGIVGFITAYDDMRKSLTVESKGDSYIVTQLASYEEYSGLNSKEEEGDYDLNKITLGCRIYTDSTHNFSGIQKAYYEEKNPLEITVTGTNLDGTVLGYNHFTGMYEIKMSFYGFSTAYYEHPDFHPQASVKIKGDSTDRNIYFDNTSEVNCLEAAYLLDDSGTLAPIDLEVCKNFHGDGGENFYSYNDWGYSDAICPMVIKANEETKFTSVLVMQNWGNYPIKQLSSIEFHVAYYHLSTGVTESNCIAPYFVYDKDGWTLPDFRGRSGEIWAEQPQFNSVGTLNFMQYSDSSVKNKVRSEFTGSIINSVGPTYADITDNYVCDNGKYTYSLRHVEMPQTDENRTYYTLKVDFNDTITFENFKRDFDLFYMDGRFFNFKKISYLDENNENVVADVSTDVTYHKLGTEAPYIGYMQMDREVTSIRVGANIGVLIKDSSIVMGGQEQNIPFTFRECTTDENGTEGVLTLDKENITFNKGDSIEISLILMPYGTGKDADNSNLLKVREDSVLKAGKLTATTGTVVEDAYLNRVKSVNNEAEFSFTGSRNNNAIIVDGFDTMKNIVVYEKIGGQWQKVNLASENGYDGYGIKLQDDGTYSFSFICEMDNPDTVRTFRVFEYEH